MKIQDAAKILNLSGQFNSDDVKKAYRKACSKYHPDRNPAGEEMMKLVNEAYDDLKNYVDSNESNTESYDFDSSCYASELNDALNAIIGIEGLTIEVCGAWVWVTGDTKPHKEILKENNFKWARKKQAWNFRPSDWKSSSRGSMALDDIRERHGSKIVTGQGQKKLQGAA